MGTKGQAEERKWLLTAEDKCDRCSSQAYVSVTGVNGELMFCGHHYNKIMDNIEGYRKMMAYAYSVVDEREKLIEIRNKGKLY
jgi:hypothetical protein